MQNLKRFFVTIGIILISALVLWVIASYFDIIMHNLEPNPIYKDWNFFKRVF